VKVWTATYTPFGGVHVSNGTIPTTRFPGQWFQSESGLHQNWMRDYDPTTGRYLQADPLGLVDGASVYGYVKQSPMMYTDPTGQCLGPVIVVCAGAAAEALVYSLALYLVLVEMVDLCGEIWDEYWLFTKANDPPDDNTTGEEDSAPPSPPFDFPHGWDGTTPPAKGYEWRGKGEPGSGAGNWHNPETGESVRPDFDHPPGIDPHVDYMDRKSGKSYRWFPNGTMKAKPPR